MIAQPERESVIQFAPRIIRPALPDAPTDGSNIMSDDDNCMAAMVNFEREQEPRQRFIKIDILIDNTILIGLHL